MMGAWASLILALPPAMDNLQFLWYPLAHEKFLLNTGSLPDDKDGWHFTRQKIYSNVLLLKHDIKFKGTCSFRVICLLLKGLYTSSSATLAHCKVPISQATPKISYWHANTHVVTSLQYPSRQPSHVAFLAPHRVIHLWQCIWVNLLGRLVVKCLGDQGYLLNQSIDLRIWPILCSVKLSH